MAVDDRIEFHKQNLQMNKDHYTYFSRFTHGRAVKYAQSYGAKCHFNEIKIPRSDFAKLL